MKYLEQPAIGNAGEYYFAYWISRYFQWPCRLLDIDIGIDAQVEILDNEKHSTGNFLAIQLKTTVDDNINTSIELKNLEYWKTIDDIVILASISLYYKEPKIYWKVINDSEIDAYIEKAKSNKSQTTTISFCDDNLLTPEDKTEYLLLPYKGSIEEALLLIDQIQEQCETINDMTSEPNSHMLDINDIENIIFKFDSICWKNESLEEIIRQFPKITPHLSHYDALGDKFDITRFNIEELVEFLCEADCEYKYEHKEQWLSSSRHRTVVEIFEEKCR